MGAGRAKQERPVIWPLPGKTGRGSQGRASTPNPSTSNPWSRRLRRTGLGLLIAAVVILLGLGLVYWRLTATVTSYTGSHFNRHQNGIWLENDPWASETHSSSEYDTLASQLSTEQVTYVYAHVGYFNSDGTIPARYFPNAATLVTALHTRVPGVHVLAWMGQGDAPDGTPSSTVNLDDSSVREQIAATAAHFVSDLGFGGVIYDIEPILNNNPRYIDLLEETRADLPAGAILSTIGQKWAPNAHVADFLRSQGKADAWWTTYYYADVAAHVDQIVPLIYNSAMPTARAYEIFVQQETEHILDAVRSARHPPQVLISLPTYPGNSFWFHDTAENMSSGLSGVTAGLNSNRDTSAFTGVAIYRYFFTSHQDWSIYSSLWLGE